MGAAIAPDAVHHWPLLEAGDCSAIVAAVEALKSEWTPRHPLAPFFTLGAASYLDGGAAPYLTAAARLNPLLDEAFGPLYGRLTHALSERLNAPVVLAERYARPGFHVFLAHPAFERPVASVHCDLQHQLVGEHAGPDETLSFTMPVALPREGGGMDVWDCDQDDWLAQSPAARLETLKTRPRRDVAYALGELVLHSGRLVHRIQASQALAPDDARITLQGHGVRREGVWHLYW